MPSITETKNRLPKEFVKNLYTIDNRQTTRYNILINLLISLENIRLRHYIAN